MRAGLSLEIKRVSLILTWKSEDAEEKIEKTMEKGKSYAEDVKKKASSTIE